eukprot:gene3038-1313_t
MLLSRTFEVDSGSMSRNQLGRRDTQTSENFWADIRNLSFNEKSDDIKQGMWPLHKLSKAKVSPVPSQTEDEEDTLSNASEGGIEKKSVPLVQTLS